MTMLAFNPGEYAVCIKDSNLIAADDTSFKEGYVYQVRNCDDFFVYFEEDSRGGTTNGWNQKFFRKVTGKEYFLIKRFNLKLPCKVPQANQTLEMLKVIFNINEELNQ